MTGMHVADRGQDGESEGSRHPAALGARIRAYRQMRRLSLRQVSEVTGLTQSFLSQIERGVSNGSIATLHLIADSLGLTLADLFSPTEVTHRVLRRAERPTIQSTGVTKYLLTQRPLRHLEVIEGHFEPGASTGGEGHTHGASQELLIVAQGPVVLLLDGEEHVLESGDSIEYDSSTPHALQNRGEQTAHVFYVISPPSL